MFREVILNFVETHIREGSTSLARRLRMVLARTCVTIVGLYLSNKAHDPQNRDYCKGGCPRGRRIVERLRRPFDIASVPYI